MISSLLGSLTDPALLLHGFGGWVLAGIAIVIFIESGVLFPFLPGDSLLVTAAILHTELGISVLALIAVAAGAAFAGDQVGYYLGHRFGVGLFKDDAKVLTTERLVQAQDFFRKYGPLSLILGRFVPIIRTFVPLAAGTAGMKYRTFIRYNVIGAGAWVVSMVLVGLLLGHIPGIAHSIDLIMLVIIGMSVLPLAISGLRKMSRSKNKIEAEQLDEVRV